MKYSSILDRSLIQSKPSTGNGSDIAQPYKLFASKYSRIDFCSSLLQSFLYLLFAFAYVCIACHIPPALIPFSTINNILTSANNSNFTFVFFKQSCHANPGPEKK